MVRRSSATIESPLASNRDSTLPTSPRRTVSGLSRTRVRWVGMALSLGHLGRVAGRGRTWPGTVLRTLLGAPLLLQDGPLGALPVDADAEEVRRGPQPAEHHAEEEHRGDHEAEADGHDLHRPAEDVAARAAQHPGRQHAEHRETEAEGQRRDGADVGHPDGHDPGQEQHHRLEHEHAGAHGAADRPGHVCRPRGLSIRRASPTVTTEPVTSTPPEPIASPNTPPSSASVAAWSMASSSRGATYTRSMPKMPPATSASSSAGSDREVRAWVQTTAASTGSSAASTPSWSLSPITPTTPMRGFSRNESSMASAVAAAPCGLCAASSRIVGLRRITSSRPGEVTSANASLTSSSSSGSCPRNASTAASAT